MSDADWKKAQTEPLQGESDLHFRGKVRLRDILKRSGYFATVEYRHHVNVDGLEDTLEIRSDATGITPERFICCECDGPGGHSTTRAYTNDLLKERRITESCQNTECYRFHYKRLVGREAWTDKEIAEEMKITTLDRPNRKWI